MYNNASISSVLLSYILYLTVYIIRTLPVVSLKTLLCPQKQTYYFPFLSLLPHISFVLLFFVHLSWPIRAHSFSRFLKPCFKLLISVFTSNFAIFPPSLIIFFLSLSLFFFLHLHIQIMFPTNNRLTAFHPLPTHHLLIFLLSLPVKLSITLPYCHVFGVTLALFPLPIPHHTSPSSSSPLQFHLYCQ